MSLSKPSVTTRPALFWGCVALLAVLCIPYGIIVYNHTGEDLFITLRFARNWLNGHGLIYNAALPQEHVEGYSNLLWLMLITGFRKLGAQNMDVTARMISLAAHAGLVVALGFYRRTGREGDEQGRRWIELFAPAAILMQPVLHYLDDGGLEAVFYSLLLFSVGVALVRRRYTLASLALGAAAATRPEAFIYWFAFAPVVAVDAWSLRKSGMRDVVQAVAVYVGPWIVCVAALLLWRHGYYGAWLPNTVHAKIPEWSSAIVRFSRLTAFSVMTSHLLLVAIILSAVLWATPTMRRHRREIVIAAVGILAIIAYATAVSGVAERKRHLAPVIPFYFALLQLCILSIAELRVRGARFWAVAAAVILLSANSYERTNADQPRTRLAARTWEFVKSPDWRERVRWFLHEPVHFNAEVGRWLAANTPRDSVVAADQIGLVGFYSDRTIIDLLGLCDKTMWKIFGDANKTLDYLIDRNVTDLAIFGYMRKGGKPADFDAAIPFLRPLLNLPRFQKNYAMTEVLVHRALKPEWSEFAIYRRRDEAQTTSAQSARVVEVGESAAEFERHWRYGLGGRD